MTLIDEDTGEKRKWRIVGEPEANASKGTISVASPIARALIGKKKGATIEVMATHDVARAGHLARPL